MANSSNPLHYVKHIESYVDASAPPAQQAASVDAIAVLLKNDMLTLESLIREMGMYLTTTDSIIRARGVLLLAELLNCLASKPLETATMRSLIGFFTERLADWKALQGALVGCLALLRRKGTVGMVGGSEAFAVAQSYLQNVQVQSLGQRDRKICFEILGCLLDRYPDDIVQLDDILISGICESIDGEKDPQCLMLAFHIVEVLVRLFSDPSSPLESFVMDLFENLSCYFPIHFTHPKGEDVGVKKDELSQALMMVFASTPLFEPFVVPLLLEKLSSSLPSTKVECLKYLSYCSEKYGADRMAKHVEALWSALKDAIFTSTDHVLSLESELLEGMSVQDNEIVLEALVLLQKVIFQNSSLLLGLIVSDEDLNTTLNMIHSYTSYNDIPMQSKQRLHAVGRTLSVSVRASNGSCNRVFESFIPRLIDALGISVQNPHEDKALSSRYNYGASYLCVELLDACRALVADLGELTSTNVSAQETWCVMLQSYSSSLTNTFSSTLATSLEETIPNAHLHSGVKGLQVLATFPEGFSPVSTSIYETILMQLMSIITLGFRKTLLWKLVLKALVDIGSFVHRSHYSEKMRSFDAIVVEKIASFMTWDDLLMPPSLKLETMCSIGMAGVNYMLKVLPGLDKALSASFSGVYVRGDVKLADLTISLLECYSRKVLPWFDNIGGFEEVPFQFAVNIWDQIESSTYFSIEYQHEKLLQAAMTAVKHAVASCSEESQSIIVHRASIALLAMFPLNESMPEITPMKFEGFQCSDDFKPFSCRDEWIISIFASVIIALRPQTHIPNAKRILQLFLTTHLKGHVPSAQAVGSIINKLAVKNGMNTSKEYSLEEAVDMILSSDAWCSYNNGPLTKCNASDYSKEIGIEDLRHSSTNSWLQTHAVIGLAWIGKGLLMRGHEKVKDIILSFLSCLLSNGDAKIVPWKQNGDREQEVLPLLRSAADAFHILGSDSEACLNRRFHATIRPLYKQRLFNIVLPILLSSIVKADSAISRQMLYRALAHLVSCTPLGAVLSEAKKLIPMLLDGLSVLSEDVLNKDIVYSVLLVLSGIITDKKGEEAILENVHSIIRQITELISYPHMMMIRETAIECLVALSELPHARIYPMRSQVLSCISKALDDPKRVVRQEAVRCRQAWSAYCSS